MYFGMLLYKLNNAATSARYASLNHIHTEKQWMSVPACGEQGETSRLGRMVIGNPLCDACGPDWPVTRGIGQSQKRKSLQCCFAITSQAQRLVAAHHCLCCSEGACVLGAWPLSLARRLAAHP